MRVRAAVAWTLGLVAAVVGLGHGTATAQQPTQTHRAQPFSASPTQHNRGSLIDASGPIAVAVASKPSAKQQHRTLSAGLVAHSWTLDRPIGKHAEPAQASQPAAGTTSTCQNVRAPPGAECA